MNLLLTKLESKHRIILFTFVVFMALVSFLHFVYVPQQQQIAALSMEKQQGEATLAQIEKFLRAHPDLAAYERELLEKQRFLDAKLPDTLEVSAFIAQIEETATASRVRLVKVNPGERADRTAYEEARVFVTVRGEYAEILDFLKRLEQSIRFYTMAEIKLQSVRGEISGDFEICIYSYSVSEKQRKSYESASNPEKE